MYQITLFFKKVIYKNNNCLISTHQKISNCTIFFNFSWGSMSPDHPSKGHGFTIMWLYLNTFIENNTCMYVCMYVL